MTSNSAVLNSQKKTGEAFPWKSLRESNFQKLAAKIESHPLDVVSALEAGVALEPGECSALVVKLASVLVQDKELRKTLGNKILDLAGTLKPDEFSSYQFFSQFASKYTAVLRSRLTTLPFTEPEVIDRAIRELSFDVAKHPEKYTQAWPLVSDYQKASLLQDLVRNIKLKSSHDKVAGIERVLSALNLPSDKERLRVLSSYVYVSKDYAHLYLPPDLRLATIELFQLSSERGKRQAIEEIAKYNASAAKACAFHWGLPARALLRSAAGELAVSGKLDHDLLPLIKSDEKSKISFLAYLAKAVTHAELRDDAPGSYMFAKGVGRWIKNSSSRFAKIVEAFDKLGIEPRLRQRLALRLARVTPGVLFVREELGMGDLAATEKLLSVMLLKRVCPSPIFSKTGIKDYQSRFAWAKLFLEQKNTASYTALFVAEYKLNATDSLKIAALATAQDPLSTTNNLINSSVENHDLKKVICREGLKGWKKINHAISPLTIPACVDRDHSKFALGLLFARNFPWSNRLFSPNYSNPLGFKAGSFGRRKMYRRIAEEACAADISAMSYYQSRVARRLLKNEESFTVLLKRTLKHGAYANLTQIARERVRLKEKFVTREKVVSEYQQILSRVKELDRDGKTHESLAKLFKAGILPSEAIGNCLRKFNKDSKDFIISKLGACGESFGETFCEGIQEIFKETTDIPRKEQRIIEAFLQSGFQGFSEETYKLFATEFRKSPARAELLIGRWKRSAEQMLDGLELPKNLDQSETAALIRHIYRPVGVSLSAIENMLRSKASRSEHLADFKSPANGFRVKVGAAGEVSLKPGLEFPSAEFKNSVVMLRHVVSGEISAGLTAQEQLQILNGDFGSIDTERVLSWIFNGGDRQRLTEAVSTIAKRLKVIEEPKKALLAIQAVEDVFGILAVEAIDSLGAEITKGINLTAKVQGQVRTVLALKKEQDVSLDDLLVGLKVQLSRYFDSLRKITSKERSKFARIGAGESREIDLVLTKAQHAYLSRAAAGLCTANDDFSWNSPRFLQMNMVDRRQRRVVGNVQLHLFLDRNDKPSVLARINPSNKLVGSVDEHELAVGTVAAIRKFARLNGLCLYLPEQGEFIMLSNRLPLVPHLRALTGPGCRANVPLTQRVTCTKIFPVDDQLLDAAS